MSLNLGVPGFNTTIGNRNRSTIGIPGSGISYHFSHGSKSKRSKNPEQKEAVVQPRIEDNIISVSPELLNSGNLEVINKLYHDVLSNKKQLDDELS